MIDRPILFSAPMVRALLASTKTQTRRVAKFVALEDGLNFAFTGLRPAQDRPGGWTLQSRDGATNLNDRTKVLRCPYGQPGDLLWVREAWRHRAIGEASRDAGPRTDYVYRSTENVDGLAERWKPSIHMPRAASRILLEVTDVRVQRLKEVSAVDCLAEGVEHWATDGGPHHVAPGGLNLPGAYYRYLWESINGAGSWDANPWVWAVSFKRVA